MSVIRNLFSTTGLGTKILGGVGATGAGVSVAVPVTMEYAKRKNSPDVARSLETSFDLVKGSLDKSKRDIDYAASQEALLAVASKVKEMEELENHLKNENNNWRINMHAYRKERESIFKKHDDDLRKQISEVEKLKKSVTGYLALLKQPKRN